MLCKFFNMTVIMCRRIEVKNRKRSSGKYIQLCEGVTVLSVQLILAVCPLRVMEKPEPHCQCKPLSHYFSAHYTVIYLASAFPSPN